MLALILVIILILLILSFVALHYKTLIKRLIIARSKTPQSLLTALKNSSICVKLQKTEGQRLLRHMKIFLAEKTFKSLQGTTPNEDQKIQVALKACLPLVNRETNYYGLIQDIYLKPESSMCFNAQMQEINWYQELYQQYVKESESPRLSKDEFIEKSNLFFTTGLQSEELERFYQLNLS